MLFVPFGVDNAGARYHPEGGDEARQHGHGRLSQVATCAREDLEPFPAAHQPCQFLELRHACAYAPHAFWMLSVPQAIVGYLLMQAFSFINGIYVTCYYKTTDWMLRWPLLLGWIGMGAILTAYLVCFAWMPGFLINIGMAVWAVLIITGLLFYLYNLKIYNEHKQKTSRFRSLARQRFTSCSTSDCFVPNVCATWCLSW